MASPLRVTDVFGQSRIEPSVTAVTRLSDSSPARPDPVNDLILIGATRSGVPLTLNRFREAVQVADYHDPDNTGDTLVALARMSKIGIADTSMLGAADILTVRADPATPSSWTIKDAGNVELIDVETVDCGSHTRRSRGQVKAGRAAGSKVVILADDVRQFTSGDLGLLLALKYTGNGSAALLTIRRESSVISYNANPVDEQFLTVNGVIFEFDDNNAVTDGRVKVAIGDTADDTFAALAAAINANIPGTTAAHSIDENTVTCTDVEHGMVVTIGSGTYTRAAFGKPSTLVVALARDVDGVIDATDGSADLNIPLQLQAYKTISQVAAFINQQIGYTCKIASGADKATSSTGLDVVSAVDVKTATVTLTGYCAAIANWINTQTRKLYTATISAYAEPHPNSQPVFFTGGNTPLLESDNWDAALAEVGAKVEKGGIIVPLTDDPAIFAKVLQFVVEQRTAGKWFRAYFGAAINLEVEDYVQIAGGIDHSQCRLFCQQPAVFGTEGDIAYLDPVFTAAAAAGAAAGNRPYDNPLTNKRFRFLDIKPSYTLTDREALEDGGVTVFKREEGTVRCAFAVTTSRDPDHRMARVAAEHDTVREIDTAMRDAFLPFRGRWINSEAKTTVPATVNRLLSEYTSRGALVDGFDQYGNARKSGRLVDWFIEAGELRIQYDIFLAGELSHVSLQGTAEYQRLQGDGAVTITTAVPIQ